jgi:hypothetical protein
LLKNPYNVFGNGDRQDGKRDGKSRLFEDGHTKTVARRQARSPGRKDQSLAS